MKRRRKKPSAVAQKLDNLSAQISYLTKMLHAHELALQELRFVRPPEERIRVVTQKVNLDPQTPFEQALAFTTNQVNQHLESLDGISLQDIIQSALTGKEIPNTKPSPMSDYLNQNFGTIVNQEAVWDTIADAKADAKQRIADRKIGAVDLVRVKQELKKIGQL